MSIQLTESENKTKNSPVLDKILNWADAALAGASVCGGKGWNLGRLYRYGFQIPLGGVIAANYYQQITSTPEIKNLQIELLKITALEATNIEITKKLNKIRDLIENIELSVEFINELKTFLDSLNLLDKAIAVRSSATAEDGLEASFAGIHTSFLNVIGLESIIKAIKGCYASLWTPQALAYRRKMKLLDDEVLCAVVLCQMVTAPSSNTPISAGVAFSCDPRTGRRNVVTINATFGLGDKLVSGHINPEEITVLYKYSQFKQIERNLVNKQVLSDEQVLKLARLVWRVHWALGKSHPPQDIEWAFDGKDFWLLQARPVTKLPQLTSSAISHLPTIWSTANIKDAVAGVPTTITWNMVLDCVTEIIYASTDEIGYKRPDGLEIARRINGRGYFEVNNMQWVFYDAFGLMPEDVNRSLGGHHPPIPIAEGNPLAGKVGRERQLRQIKFLLAILKTEKNHPNEINELTNKTKQWKAIDVSKRTNQELFYLLEEMSNAQYDFAYKFQLANAVAGAWVKPIYDTLMKIKPERAESLTNALLTGTGQITTAEHGYRLYSLATTAQKDADALNYLNQKSFDPKAWCKLPAKSLFRKEFEGFLEEFGHRAVYEAEVANPRWNEDPSYLLEQIQIILKSGNSTPPQNKALELRQKAEKEISELSLPYRFILKWLIKKARYGAGLRELSKSTLVRAIEPIRKVMLEIGRRMVIDNLLDEPTDIFHLSGLTTASYLLGEWSGKGAKELASDNKLERAKFLAQGSEDCFIFGLNGNLNTSLTTVNQPTLTITETAEGLFLKGLGVASGKASGQARIILHPEEGNLLAPGEILIAPSTDPGWTPLFLRASAVVMEIGGFLSHGAIVAREYGLPAVVNIPNLLSLIKNDDKIIVDGDKGEVIIKR
ncbi:MAG: pyruvate, phosphate dikinase [Acidobacteria bacterium]|nr:pyruvate, phosphate dikinase [Acidobacteriota bacterium]